MNHGRRYRKGLPIGSATAESAVNQVVSSRMAKHRQMRWSDEAAHLLAQVRVHALNDELKPRAMPIWLRAPKLVQTLDGTQTCSGGQGSPHFGPLSGRYHRHLDDQPCTTLTIAEPPIRKWMS